MNFLREQDRQQLKLQHKRERDKRVCDRIKAILLFDEGWTPQQIAKVLLISDEAVSNHINEYKSSRKLKPANGGSEEKLSTEQAKRLDVHLREHTYLYVKDVVAYVKGLFNVEYTVPGMTHWLRSHGFSYKKPSVMPGKVNAEAQRKWIEEYQQLKANLPEQATICFTDGVHPTHNAKPMYGWIKKGIRKELLTNTGRQRINLTGAIDIFSRRVLIQEDETLDADATISFLQKLAQAYPHKDTIHLFCDNARYYKNKAVAAYLTTSKIKMHFLPPYSPNLNPIERLWKLTNERVLYNKYYEKFCDFKNELLGFLESLFAPTKEIAELLKRRINDNFYVMKSTLANS
jgi:transposase